MFTIGDEPALNIPASALKRICGTGEYKNFTPAELLAEARKTYDVYHIHVRAGSNGRSQSVMNGWKELMGENLLIVEDADNVAQAIADTVLKHKQGSTSSVSVASEEIL